jgi:hypothetical protein
MKAPKSFAGCALHDHKTNRGVSQVHVLLMTLLWIIDAAGHIY